MMDLDELGSLWETAEEADTFTPIEDGKYVAKVDVCRFDKTKSGDPKIYWELVIQGGNYAGRKLFLNRSLKNAQMMGFAKADFKKLNLPHDTLQEVKDSMAMSLDKLIEVTVKTKMDKNNEPQQNIYINKMYDGEAVTDNSPQQEETVF